MTESSDERRKHVRVDTSGAIPAQVALMIDAKLLDISARGMRLEVPFRPESDQRYEFAILFKERVVKVAGIVRDIAPLTDELTAVGIEFVALHPDDHGFLLEYTVYSRR